MLERRGDGREEEVLERRPWELVLLARLHEAGSLDPSLCVGDSVAGAGRHGMQGGRAREQQRMEEEAMWRWSIGSI